LLTVILKVVSYNRFFSNSQTKYNNANANLVPRALLRLYIIVIQKALGTRLCQCFAVIILKLLLLSLQTLTISCSQVTTGTSYNIIEYHNFHYNPQTIRTYPGKEIGDGKILK